MKLVRSLILSITVTLSFSSCSSSNEKEMYAISYPNKTTFNVGEAFTSEGLLLMDTDSYEYIAAYNVSYYDGYIFKISDVGTQKVNITKKGYKTLSYDILVTNYPALEISGNPTTEFNYGDYFSTEGLVVTASGEEVTDYVTSLSVDNRLTKPGEIEVIVSKTGYASTSYVITVYPAKQLYVSTPPSKTEYDVGDVFATEGLEVIDEKNNVVTDYTLSINNGDYLNFPGKIDVEISKDGYIPATLTLEVNEPSGGETTYRDLTIYYLNDTHGHYNRDESLSEAGMAYISSYIKSKKEADLDNTIVLSGGDMFQGGYLSNETRGQSMIDAMNEIGFDAMVLGNHEFDWGEEYIYTFADGLDCPIISANTFYNEGEKNVRPTWLTPYHIIDKGNLRIGIIGGAEENMGSHVTGSIGNQFYFPKPISYIKNYSHELRITHKCDIVIAAFHEGGFSGYSGDPTYYQALTEIDASTNRKYVDGMFFAHDHLRKDGVYNGVPYLEAGCNGKNIGEMTFSIETKGTYSSITSSRVEVKWATSTCQTRDPAFDMIDTKYADEINKGKEVIYNFANDYDSDSFTDVACEAMLWYVNSHKEEFDNTTVSVASHNAGGVREDVKAGQMTYETFVTVFPFDNKLCIQRCSKSNMNSYDSYAYYHTVGTPIYESDGCARVASINYITESQYAYRYQVDYVPYDITVKTILYLYLKGNINPNL